MTREEIKSKLEHGDESKIARRCATSRDNVYKYFTGQRKGISEKYKRMHAEGERIAMNNTNHNKQENE